MGTRAQYTAIKNDSLTSAHRTQCANLIALLTLGVYLLSFASCKRHIEHTSSTPCEVKALPSTTRSNETPHSDGTPSPAVLSHYKINPVSLPPPFLTPSADRRPLVAPKTVNAILTLPPGFHISTFAEGALESPRWMALASNGDVFVTESQAGRVTVLRDTDNDGRADQRFDFASGLNRPFGLAFWRSYLYVANTNSVVRFKYKPGQEKMIEEPEKVVALPGNGYNQHWTRNVVFSPDGSKQIKAHRLQDHPDTIQQR
jgi:glucose/arabinose dehydrogenase